METNESFDRVLFCDRCGGEVKTVPVEWISFDPVLCRSCRDEGTDQSPRDR